MKARVASLAVLAALACSSATNRDRGGGRVVAVVQPLAAALVTRVTLEVSPAGVTQDLSYNAADGTFAGILTVPVGAQTLTATAFVGDAVYGTGAAFADVTENGTALVYLSILDASGRKPAPDHGPVVTSITVSNVTPLAGEQIQLAASAVDPDRDPISFAWSDVCGGAFSAATSATTTWSSETVGLCRVTVTATSRQLSDARAVTIRVRSAPTGQIEITGIVVPQPTIDVVTFSDAQAQSCTMLRGGPGADGTCHMQVLAGARLAVTLAASDLIPTAAFSLTDDCGGSAEPGAGSTFTWTAPAAGGLCIVAVAVSQAGLSDLFPVAVFVEPTVLAGRVVTNWMGSTVAAVPSDLSVGIVEAFDAFGARHVGRGDAAGNFWFDALPDGVVTIHVEGPGGPARYHATARRGWLDLESSRPGREDTVVPTAPTPMTVNALGVDPASVPRLEYYDTNGGFASGSGSLVFDPFYTPNDGLLDTSRGDVALIAQLSSATAPDGTAYAHATQVGTVEPVTVQDGVPSTIMATLLPIGSVAWTPPPLDAAFFGPMDDFPLVWNNVPRRTLSVQAFPAWTNGLFTPAATYLSLLSVDLSGLMIPPALGELRHGDLPGWTPIFRAQTSRCCTSSNPIPGGPTVGFGVATSYTDVLGGGPMETIGFVHDLRIDGQGALQTLTGVSPTPTITWTPPATGPVGAYRIIMRRITTYGGRFRMLAMPVITTDETSLRVPPGLLEAGATYYATIVATNSSPTAPGLQRFPHVNSSVTTGAFTIR